MSEAQVLITFLTTVSAIFAKDNPKLSEALVRCAELIKRQEIKINELNQTISDHKAKEFLS